VYGAVVGGFLVGVSEVMLTTWGQQIIGVWVGEYRPLVPMIFLVAVLLIEPAGLQGAYDKFMASERGGKMLQSIGLKKKVG
jgi:branched-subunit amino acid ABC-type transport system permease component